MNLKQKIFLLIFSILILVYSFYIFDQNTQRTPGMGLEYDIDPSFRIEYSKLYLNIHSNYFNPNDIKIYNILFIYSIINMIATIIIIIQKKLKMQIKLFYFNIFISFSFIIIYSIYVRFGIYYFGSTNPKIGLFRSYFDSLDIVSDGWPMTIVSNHVAPIAFIMMIIMIINIIILKRKINNS